MNRSYQMAKVRNVAKGYRKRSNAFERTPEQLFLALKAEYDFTLDAASSDLNHLLLRYFTVDDDGLSRDWSGERVWLNPPYGRGVIGRWIKKAYEESCKGALVVCLVPANTDQDWWHDYVMPYASEIRFIRGRLQFEADDERPGRGAFGAHCIVVFGTHGEAGGVTPDPDNVVRR